MLVHAKSNSSEECADIEKYSDEFSPIEVCLFRIKALVGESDFKVTTDLYFLMRPVSSGEPITSDLGRGRLKLLVYMVGYDSGPRFPAPRIGSR